MSTNEPAGESSAPTSPVQGHEQDGITVDQLRAELDETNYTSEELTDALAFERSLDDSRSTAIEALQDAFDDATGEPDIDTSGASDPSASVDAPAATTAMDVSVDEADENGHVDSRRVFDGGGATEAGVAGVVLPAPESEDAPPTVRVFTPVKTPIGQRAEPYTVGVHNVPYTRQVKNQLETETNRLRLDESDPLHPNHGDTNESTGGA